MLNPVDPQLHLPRHVETLQKPPEARVTPSAPEPALPPVVVRGPAPTTETLAVGQTVEWGGFQFAWDGERFRCEAFERVIRAMFYRRMRQLAIVAVVGLVGVWFVVSRLGWDTMPYETRRAYSVAGRLILIVWIGRFLQSLAGAPDAQVDRADAAIRRALGIGRA